jgi:hypothetical protein
MTPEERQQAIFEAAIRERLAERARILLLGNEEVIALLQSAQSDITDVLAAQPADWQLWQLTKIKDQVDVVLTAVGQKAAGAVDGRLRDAWQQGEDVVDKPLNAVGLGVEMRLGMLDANVLSAMRTFTHERLKDVSAEAVWKIGRQLGLVTIGGTTPFEAIKAVQRTLGDDSTRRATTIVQTEVSRAFAVASATRLRQAARLVDGLGKQWRRSGKIHSRWNHDVMDGLVVAANERFKVPDGKGGFDMMTCPHDPTAPAGQVINCGCIALPHMKNWKVMTPGAKPFSKLELQLDGRKADLDARAKNAGLRQGG